MIGIITKIVIWIKMNLTTLLSPIQLVIKALKELLTAIINLVSIVFPVIATEKVILAIRAGLNLIDDWISQLKDGLVPAVK